MFFASEMVETEYHQRVAIGENALVDRLTEPGLVCALEHRDRMAGDFFRNALEAQRRNVEQLQCSGYPLEEVARLILLGLVSGPQHVADFRDGREAVLD